jgi:MFS family permease
VTARIYYAACAALIGYALAYTLPIYGRLPHTFYDPVARRWFFAANATPIPMGYIGQIVWGFAGALIAAGVTMAVTARRPPAPPSERGAALGAAWALTVIAIVIGYFTWNNWP